MRLLTLASLFVLALAACGGSAESTTVTPSPTEPTRETSQAGSVWHKTQVDATNLRIDSNGHFEWKIFGCDFSGGDEGRWEPHAEGGIVLLPANGYEFFEWSHDGSFKSRALALRLTRDGEDMTVRGSMEDGSTITQTWHPGCACAVCGGSLGPTGQKACEEPLPEICVPE